MVDAVGGVAKIVGVALKIKEAANTVHQNKKDCHHIKSRVDILNRTLSHHEDNTELVEDSAVMAALEALDGILAEALEVITKCQEPRNIVCVYYTAGNLSRKLSKVEQRISYLSTDVMLTIMSYQLLRKSQESAPHPPPQTNAVGTHTPPKQPSPPQKSHSFTRERARASAPERHSSASYQMSKQNQDEANKKDPTRTPQVPPFGEWDEGHLDQAESYEHIFNRVREEKPTRARHPRQGSVAGSSSAPSCSPPRCCAILASKFFRPTVTAASSYSSYGSVRMTGELRRSLVRRIAEVTRDIKEAVETVLQNKDDCVEIGKCANRVSTLLPQLEDTKMADDPAMQGALEKLLATFRRAHTLFIACQRRGRVIAWLSTPAGGLSIQLHEVLDQIASNIADMTAIVLP